MTPGPHEISGTSWHCGRTWLKLARAAAFAVVATALTWLASSARADPIASNLSGYEAVCFDGYVSGLADNAATFLALMREAGRVASDLGISEDPQGCWGQKPRVITVWIQLGVTEAPHSSAFVLTLEGVAGGPSSLPFRFPVVWSATLFGALHYFEVNDALWEGLITNLLTAFGSDWAYRNAEPAPAPRDPIVSHLRAPLGPR